MPPLCLPHFAAGKVIKGFGRGSKELGIPTANFGQEVIDELPAAMDTGVYYGWASVNSGPVYKMVMSIGWNPYYQNIHKSMETHVMHTFTEDFYGEELRVCITGYIRPEMNFKSLDELIATINKDIHIADKCLNTPEHVQYKTSSFFNSESTAQ